MKHLSEMIKPENGSFLCGKKLGNIVAENATELKRKTIKLIKSGELQHGYYIASPSNGRNKVWKL